MNINPRLTGNTIYGQRVNGPETDPKKIAGVGPHDGSPGDRAAAAGGGAAMADAMARQQALRDQFANPQTGGFDMQKMIDAIRARAATSPQMPALPALPAQAPMQAPPAANWMQGPMLSPMQAALARRTV